MDLFTLGMLMLFVMGILYSTVFAFLEYHDERTVEFQEDLKRVTEEEVFRAYVWPLMCHKLADWSETNALTILPPDRSAQNSSLRHLYVSLRRALFLTPDEVEGFRDRCHAALLEGSRWRFRCQNEVSVDDACSVYLFLRLPLDGLLDYIQQLNMG